MGGFHDNRALQEMIGVLIGGAKVTSFVETGTYCGSTTAYMAQNYPGLPIFSCEVNEDYHKDNVARLQKYKNVQVFLESSEKFVARLVSEQILGDLPMFFLDAHWYDYWPLPDEMAVIGKMHRFIAIVDDFLVPGQPQFGFDTGGGGTVGKHRTKKDSRTCDMFLIKPFLPSDCEMGYPAYGMQDVPEASHLRGHVIIVHGVDNVPHGNGSRYSWGDIR